MVLVGLMRNMILDARRAAEGKLCSRPAHQNDWTPDTIPRSRQHTIGYDRRPSVPGARRCRSDKTASLKWYVKPTILDFWVGLLEV